VGEEAGSDLVGIASLTEQEMVFKAELEQAIGERDRGFCSSWVFTCLVRGKK
jgi:hypothetical protein